MVRRIWPEDSCERVGSEVSLRRRVAVSREELIWGTRSG